MFYPYPNNVKCVQYILSVVSEWFTDNYKNHYSGCLSLQWQCPSYTLSFARRVGSPANHPGHGSKTSLGYYFDECQWYALNEVGSGTCSSDTQSLGLKLAKCAQFLIFMNGTWASATQASDILYWKPQSFTLWVGYNDACTCKESPS